MISRSLSDEVANGPGGLLRNTESLLVVEPDLVVVVIVSVSVPKNKCSVVVIGVGVRSEAVTFCAMRRRTDGSAKFGLEVKSKGGACIWASTVSTV